MPAKNFTKLSVVIALHGERTVTEQCLHSLRADVPHAEVVCVDNASPDDTLLWLHTQPQLIVVSFPQNRGVPAAWNAGLRLATGEVLCVLNNDVLIHPGGMAALACAAGETGIAAFAGGVLDERLEFVRHTNDPKEADYPDGCALAFRREVYEQVGEFDEGMGIGYYEDVDWGWRARSLGYQWAILPEILTHLGARTSRHLPDMAAVIGRNQARLRERWGARGLPGGEIRNAARTAALEPLIDEIADAVVRKIEERRKIEAISQAVLQRMQCLAAGQHGNPLPEGAENGEHPAPTVDAVLPFIATALSEANGQLP